MTAVASPEVVRSNVSVPDVVICPDGVTVTEIKKNNIYLFNVYLSHINFCMLRCHSLTRCPWSQGDVLWCLDVLLLWRS